MQLVPLTPGNSVGLSKSTSVLTNALDPAQTSEPGVCLECWIVSEQNGERFWRRLKTRSRLRRETSRTFTPDKRHLNWDFIQFYAI